MWFSVVCTLIDNDTRHHSGQNVVDSRGADNERNLCQDFTDADLKVPALRCANEHLVRDRLSFLSKTFANSLNMQKQCEKVLGKRVIASTRCR